MMNKQQKRDHYNKSLKIWRESKEVKICEYCGAEYKTVRNGIGRFCSSICRSAWRRREGLDLVERVCVSCGRTFKTNKYKKAVHCSNKCIHKLDNIK